MQAIAFFTILMVVVGNIFFFVLPILFAVAVAGIEEIVNIYMLITGKILHINHGHREILV